jgi:Zn-dependent protease with chaperone function
MVPDLSLLVALILGLFSLADPTTRASVDPLRTLAGTGAITLVVVALTRLAADRAVRAVEEHDAEALVRAGRGTTLWPLLGWLVVLNLFDWGTFVGTRVPRVWFLVPHAALFLPLAIMVGSGWSAIRRVETHFQPDPDAPGAIRRGLGRNALVLIPLLVLTALGEAFYVLAELRVEPIRRAHLVHQAFPDLEVLVVFALSAAIGYFAPAIIRRLLNTRPLPPGPVRAAIEQQMAALSVRAKDLLLWETRGRVLNAMVVGLTGRTRFVIVSDALLARLPLPEVLAVVSHEAGHARLRHLQWFLLVGLSSILFFRSAEELLGPSLGPAGGLFLTFLSLAFFWFGMLGWLSRRFERQADVFGALHGAALLPDAPDVALPPAPAPVPAGTAAMMGALDRVAGEGGAKFSHRHGSIADRIGYLARFALDRPTRETLATDTRRVKWILVAFALVALGSTAARVPGGYVRGQSALSFGEGESAADDGNRLTKEGDAAGARVAYARARDAFLASSAHLTRRPDDVRLRSLACLARFNAADLDARHGAGLAHAKAGYEEALALSRGALDHVRDLIGFHARIDLARVALRDPDPVRGLADARRLRAEAEPLADGGTDRPLRSARLRFLTSAIRLRDPDPAVAAQARRDLELQARGSGDGPNWDDLAADARDELARVPAATPPK